MPPEFMGPRVEGSLYDRALDNRLSGQERFDDLMRHAPTGNADEYDNWILNQSEDPNDILFTRLLRQEKARAREAQFKRAPSFGRPEDETKRPTTVGNQAQAQRATKEIGVKSDAPMTDFYNKEPIIKGAPMGTGEIFQRELEGGKQDYFSGDPNDPNRKPSQDESDPLLKEFANREGLSLNRRTEEALVVTGDYVYVGEEKDKFGFKRPVYVYKDDAKASIAKWSPNKVKQVQKRLGLPETGLLDEELANLWDQAVTIAGERYAKAGLKVTPEFIFETWVKIIEAELAKKGRGGGGGGGGAGGPGMGEIDYYFAAMNVFGDISGVEDGSLGG
jgi:hypothetical protein